MLVVKVPIQTIHIQVDDAGQPINPRGPITDTVDLQQSIAQEGLIHPIKVRWMPGAKETAYYLVHGERRLVAARTLGWQEIDAIVQKHESSPEDDIMQMLAADAAKSYPPLYLAKSFARLRDAGKTMKEIADAWGKTPDQVSAHIQLLDAAPPAKKAVMDGRMGMSVFSLVKHLPPDEQEEIINGAGDTVSMRYVKEKMRQRRATMDDSRAHPPSAPDLPDRSAKADYHTALTAVRDVAKAQQDGRLPARFEDWPADIRILHDELLAALEAIRPFGEEIRLSVPTRKPAPVFL